VLLLVVVCAVGFAVAYRTGLERGYKEAELNWGAECVDRAYVLTDLAGPLGHYSPKAIENMLTVCIDPTSWETVGGPASIKVITQQSGNSVFAISQQPGAHKEIERILAELRAGTD
jgi:hypothetical protein